MMNQIRGVALTALAMLVMEVSSRGQILGAMNEVDDDNNIVGNVPFYDLTPPSQKSSVVAKVAFILKSILALVIIAGLIGGLVYVYRKYGDKVPKIKAPKVMKKASTNPKNSFHLFNDDEAAST